MSLAINSVNDFATASGVHYQEHFLNFHVDDQVNQWTFKFPRGIPYFYRNREQQIATACDPIKCPPNSSVGCECFVHLNVTLGNIVQLTIFNMGEGSNSGTGFSHPFHLHGTHFYVLKTGYAIYNETTGLIIGTNTDLPCDKANLLRSKCNDLKWTKSSWLNGQVEGINLVDPSFRDTVVVPASGYLVIRFRAVNPGWFFAHCHLMDHEMGGMAFALRVGEHDQMPVPPENFPHSCGSFEQPPISKA